MLTPQEAAALAQILQRIPLTQAEALWLNALLARLTERPNATTAPAEATHAPQSSRP